MRNKSGFIVVLSIALLVLSTSVASADVIVLQDGLNGYLGTQDATIMQNSATTPHDYLSDGGRFVQESWGATLSPFTTTLRWTTGMLRFDDMFASLPVGSTIDSATLSVWVTNQIEGAHLATMSVDWNETTVTWNDFGSGDPSVGGGVTPGVEADSTLQDVGNLGPGPWPMQVNIDVTSTVQSWQQNAGTNFGWAFLRDDYNKGLFVASEDSVLGERPMLTIEFTPVPEPGAILLLGIGSLGLLAVSRRTKRRCR